MKIKIGIDTGGTFTDFFYFKDGEYKVLKLHSTTQDPSKSILDGLHQILREKKELRNARLCLITAISYVLKSGLNLLGIDVLEEM